MIIIIENPTFAHFRHFSSLFTNLPAYKALYIYVPIRHYICRGSSTKQLLFMKNKPNLQDAQMNLSIYHIKEYENFIPLAGYKNKPNSNPIEPCSERSRMGQFSPNFKNFSSQFW